MIIQFESPFRGCVENYILYEHGTIYVGFLFNANKLSVIWCLRYVMVGFEDDV